MKKFIAAISLLVYLTTTSGVVISSHYCMKRLVAVHLFENQSDECGLCGMDMDDNSGCCHDEVKVVKLVQDQVRIPFTSFELASPAIVSANVTDCIITSVSHRYHRSHLNNHSPPLLSRQDTYLQINVFRI